jgi:hypothetical protein
MKTIIGSKKVIQGHLVSHPSGSLVGGDCWAWSGLAVLRGLSVMLPIRLQKKNLPPVLPLLADAGRRRLSFMVVGGVR